MNALAQHFVTRVCPRCKARQPGDRFAGVYCRACRRDYDNARNAAIRAGTWRPTPREDYVHRRATPPPAAAPCAPVPLVAAPPGGIATDDLRTAMEAVLVAHGFTRLKATMAVLESELSKKHRGRLARQGWIA